MKLIKSAALSLSLLCAVSSVHGDALEDSFVTPTDATRPRCYWYWLDGHVSKEGITKDLEAMKRVGIGEGYIGIIHGMSTLPANPDLKPLSDTWWETVTHAIREGGRLGVDVGFFNSPGWSESGGPWVKPTQAMRYVVTPEVRIRGPVKYHKQLPTPGENFQQIAVMAFPAPTGEEIPKGKETRTPSTVTIELDTPLAARSVTIQPTREINTDAKLEASDDGNTWSQVTQFKVDRHFLSPIVGPVPLAPIVASFPTTTAKFFRVTFAHASETGGVTVSAAARVESYMEKQLAKVFQDPQPPFDFYTWPLRAEPDAADAVVKLSSIQNLTKQVADDGTLTWNVPAGDWIIVRAGMLPTGTRNSPAAPELTGLEIDKMNRAAATDHFNAFLGDLLKRIPESDRKAFKHVVSDSYETGSQNWSDGFADIFAQRYGYDPLPFLPVMTGRVVGSVDQSDRFLWDLRRLVADRIASEYVGGLRELCNQYGLKLWLENYGHWGFPAEFLQYGGASDEVGGEFWQAGSGEFNNLGSIELRAASSSAHTYGKKAVFAEAFTGGPLFVNSPRDFKARGDWALCEGINQFVMHVVIHQPDDRKPGMSAWFGSEFNRNNTWFEMSKAWYDYQRRCTTLLQQGVHVADVAFFIGEDTPKMTGSQAPGLPKGFDYDYINAEVLLTRAQVKDKRLVLPDGMSYSLLVLPPSETMRPEVLKQIASFVDQGLPVFGPLPTRSPSMENYPQCDEEVENISASIKDRVKNGPDLKAALNLHADFGGVDEDFIRFIHRKTEQADIYFVSNQSVAPVVVTPAFRVTGMACELWHADTGAIERVAVEAGDGVSKVTLELDGSGSVFVVFRPTSSRELPAPSATTADRLEITRAVFEAIDGSGGNADVTERLAGMVRNGTLRTSVSIDTLGSDPAFQHVKQLRIEYAYNGKSGTALIPEGGRVELPPGDAIAGPWKVEIGEKNVTFDTLSSWSTNQEPAIRYFSGTATYQTTFMARPVAGTPVVLDLGQVDSLAEVTLNGKRFTALWKAPYKVDISSAIRSGENTLTVRVVNVWHNRLVGEVVNPKTSPAPAPWTSRNPGYQSKEPLMSAGLIGPVSIRGASLEPRQ